MIAQMFTGMEWLCNAIVGRPFQADVACRVSLSLGRLGQPGKADLQMRCKAGMEWRPLIALCLFLVVAGVVILVLVLVFWRWCSPAQGRQPSFRVSTSLQAAPAA